MASRKTSLWAVAASSLFAMTVGALSSCSRSADPVPLRTFERAQNLDVLCMQVSDDAGNPVRPPQPAPQSKCTAVPPGVTGSSLPYHLFALVTQTARGEVAVVDLTAGRIVDVDHSTPGVNFLPVGVLPTDVVTAPDSRISFIATAEPNKWAIYALPSAPPAPTARESRGILGDEFGQAIPRITDWPVCALPQAPGSMSILPRGEDPAAGYDLAVVLPGTGREPTKIAILDPAPFLAGAGIESGSTKIDPGSLVPCQYATAITITADVPASVPLGPVWADGVPYADPRRDIPLPRITSCVEPGPAPAPTLDGGAGEAGADADVDAGAVAVPALPGDVPRAVHAARDGSILFLADEGLPLIHVIDFTKPREPRELAPLVATSVSNQARRVSIGKLAISPATRDLKRFLYAVDRQDGSLMVFDVTNVTVAGSPRMPMRRPHPELNPFQPVDRITFDVPITSIEFVRHDWPLYLENDLPVSAPKTGLLCNPNPNANAAPGVEQPFRDPGAYYRHNGPPGSGLDRGLEPLRLRGVFGFATLSSGQLAIIDVDDWDAPCRRPDPMGVITRLEPRTRPDGSVENVEVETDQTGGTTPLAEPFFSAPAPGNRARRLGASDLAPLMPAPADDRDLDPYHAPLAFYQTSNSSFTTGVSNEAFFPVSAPHRPRSLYMLRRDSTTGIHIPHLPTLPQLRSKGAAISTIGPNALKYPMMTPTYSALPDPGQVKVPTEPNPRARELSTDQTKAPSTTAHLPLESTRAGVRFAWEDPTVHVDQDWVIAYEGALPGFDRVSATIAPEDSKDPTTLELRVPNGLLCERGVMDHEVAAQRASSIVDTFDAAVFDPRAPLLRAPARLQERVGDYVQIIDDLLPADNPYWSAAEPDGDSCWDESLRSAADKHAACSAAFGAAGDESPSRDFPILKAYSDRLVLGTYRYQTEAKTPDGREVLTRGAANAAELKFMRCCFHRQARFRVRAGAEWTAVGSVSGFLHSMTTDAGGACVPSCRAEDALLSGRAPQVPRPFGILETDPRPPSIPENEWPQLAARREALKVALGRNSPLTMRNPMFAIVMWNEVDTTADRNGASPARGIEWAFSTRGRFSPLAINLGVRTVSIAPQTLKFIEPIRQIAVVDASNQGLQLYDLQTLAAVRREPYL